MVRSRNMKRNPERSEFIGRPIRHDRVGLGVGGDRRKMRGREVDRAQHDAAGDAVELDQRHRGRKLIAREQQHRSAGELGQASAEA